MEREGCGKENKKMNTIEKDNSGQVIITCDNCKKYEKFETNGFFLAAMKKAEENGWGIKREMGKTLKHYCPNCVKLRRKEKL